MNLSGTPTHRCVSVQEILVYEGRYFRPVSLTHLK
jgi:hypothetical protein